jgi:ubiquinone/menaquinone biosynthesis C-methylase UbiE
MSLPPPDYLGFQIDFGHPETVAAYDELPLWSALFGRLLLEHVPLRHHMTVLDVGCGTGFPLLELAQRLGSTCTVYGIDPWEPAVERAAFKARVWGVQNVELRLGDAAAMPFADGQFDLLVSNLGINNFEDPEAVLRECWRVSKPTARLALTTNLQGHMQEVYDVFAATLRARGAAEELTALERHIAHRATIDGVAALFARAGFRLARVDEESTTFRFVDGSALLRHYFIKLGFLDGWKSVVEPSEQETVFRQLEENLNRLAAERGVLEVTIPMAYIEGERAPWT